MSPGRGYGGRRAPLHLFWLLRGLVVALVALGVTTRLWRSDRVLEAVVVGVAGVVLLATVVVLARSGRGAPRR